MGTGSFTWLFSLKLFEKSNGLQQARYLFYHHFLQGIGQAFLLLVSHGLFLSKYSVAHLAFIYIVSGMALLVISRLVVLLERWVKVGNLLTGITVFMGLGMGLVWLFLWVFEGSWPVFLVLIWYRLAYFLASLKSWLLSTRLFDLNTHRQQFEWVSIGDLPARVFGFLLAYLSLGFIESHQLLLLGAVCFMVSVYPLRWAMAFGRKKTSGQPARPRIAEYYLKSFLGNGYTRALGILTSLLMVVLVLVTYSFFASVQLNYPSTSETTHYLALFFGCSYLATFLLKGLVSGKTIAHVGVRLSLMLMPAVVLAFAVSFLLFFYFQPLFPGDYLWLLAPLLFCIIALKYTLQDPVLLSLFQPLTTNLRNYGFVVANGFLNPLGLLLTGLLLAFFFSYTNLTDIRWLFMVIMGLSLVWLTVIVTTSRLYVSILEKAVKLRFLKTTEVSMKNEGIVGVLRQRLQSPEAEEVIYALEMLQKMGVNDQLSHLSQALNHPSERVLCHALEHVWQQQAHSLSDKVAHLLEDHPSSQVKACAIMALCQLSPESSQRFLVYLSSQDPEIMKGAIAGLLRSKAPDLQEQAKKRVHAFLSSENTAEVNLGLAIVGQEKLGDFAPEVSQLVTHQEAGVQKMAIKVCGQLKETSLLPLLFGCIRQEALHKEAMSALVAIGEAALPAIELVFEKATKHHDIYLIRLCQVCGKIGNEQAKKLLWRLLIFPWKELQISAVQALKNTKFKAKTQVERLNVIDQLEKDIAQSYWLFAAQEILERKPRYKMLKDALAEESEILYAQVETLLAFLGIESKAFCRANYLLSDEDAQDEDDDGGWPSYASNMPFHDQMRRKLAMLLEEGSYQQKLGQLSYYYSVQLFDDIGIVAAIIRSPNRSSKFTRWTQATALLTVEDLENPYLLKSLANYLLPKEGKTIDKLLANAALENLKGFCEKKEQSLEEFVEKIVPDHQFNEIRNMLYQQEKPLLDIEKVLILKGTRMFSETPDYILADVAKIVQEVWVEKGENIFHKGDPGDCMYIIYEGEIRIHDGDHTLNTLINKDFFGDLGLLDTHPRSASATAERDSLLLKIDQEAFYQLMTDRTEVARGIMQVLCDRIRTQSTTIKDLKMQRHTPMI